MKNIFDIFRRPTPLQLAREELAEAQRELLRVQSAAEFHSAMVTCLRGRVIRLQGIVDKGDM